MKAYIATVGPVIRTQSWAQARDGVFALFTENGMHDTTDPVLFDRSYVPEQIHPRGAWPREIDLPDGLTDHADKDRDVAALFALRQHVEPMLIMSTAHLDRPSRAFLDSGEGIVIADRHGWIVYTRQDVVSALRPLLDFVMAQGFLWIKFDADGPVFDGLPAFEW